MTKEGGGVSLCFKEAIPVKVRNNLLKSDDPIKVLFIEIHGGNKNTPYLLAVTYQPSSTESDKLSWLDSFESSLFEVTTKLNGFILVKGDTNIDLVAEPKQSTKRCKKHSSYFQLAVTHNDGN